MEWQKKTEEKEKDVALEKSPLNPHVLKYLTVSY